MKNEELMRLYSYSKFEILTQICYNVQTMNIWRGNLKLKLTAIISGVFIVLFPQIGFATLESDLQQKKDQLDDAQNAARNKANEAKNLTTQINNLDSDIKSTDSKLEQTKSKITQTQSEIDQLSGEVEIKKKELAELKKKINVLIVELYRFSSRSSLEALFLSDNLSDTANEEDYVAAVQMQVKVIYGQVDSIKNGLEEQKSQQEAKKAELDQLKSQQDAYIQGASYQKTQKDKLLGMTVEQQKEYEQEAVKAAAEVARVEEQIRISIASRKANSDGTYGSGPRVGQRVSKGDFVGIQGSTGFSTGDHVHFEVDTVRPMVGYTNPHDYVNNGIMDWPLRSFRITQDYWEFWSASAYPSTGGYHMGIDIAGPSGSPVFAPADGMVVLDECPSGCNRGYGHAWAMKVDNGPYVLLGHLR